MRKNKKISPNHLFTGAMIMVSLCSFTSGKSQMVKEEKKTTNEIKPGRKKATLILSDGSKIKLEAQQDTTLTSKVNGIQIKIDSTGINYIEKGKKEKNNPSGPLPKKKR